MLLSLDHSMSPGILLLAVLDPSLIEARHPTNHFLERAGS